jgi:hypothetical protein
MICYSFREKKTKSISFSSATQASLCLAFLNWETVSKNWYIAKVYWHFDQLENFLIFIELTSGFALIERRRYSRRGEVILDLLWSGQLLSLQLENNSYLRTYKYKNFS